MSQPDRVVIFGERARPKMGGVLIAPNAAVRVAFLEHGSPAHLGSERVACLPNEVRVRKTRVLGRGFMVAALAFLNRSYSRFA